jgi:ABC-type uncharacterized transport system involved in gliding motility auxiliary subunit
MSFQKIKDSVQEFRWASIAPYLLAAGVIGLVAALIAYLVRGSADVYTYVPLLVGVVGVLSFAFLDPDRIQSWMGSRQARYGTTLAITGLSLVGIVILVNYIVYQASTQTKLSVDITEDKTNSLSDETIRTMHTLTEPIEIRAYYGPQNSNWEAAQALLDKYVAESRGQLTYTKVDPDAAPLQAKEDGVSRDGTLVLAQGERKQLVTNAAENEITTAVLKLMNPGEHKVYFLTGHGEATIEGVENTDISTLVGTLRNKNYTVDTLNLTREAKIPADAKVLFIAGPKTPLLDSELQAIKDYLQAGGGLILLQNPYAVTEMDPEKDILAGYLKSDWGITLRPDIIIDLENRYLLNPFASQYNFEGQTSPITERIPGNMYSVFPTALSLQLDMPAEKSLSQIPFVIIDAPDNRVWGETDPKSVGLISILSESKSATYDKSTDNASPLNVGVSVEDASTSSRVVVFGDEDFAENQIVNQGAGANSDLIANSVDWVSQQENLINLTPKDQTYRYMSLPQDAWVLNAIVLTSACLLPASFLLLYGVVWYNRRKHR